MENHGKATPLPSPGDTSSARSQAQVHDWQDDRLCSLSARRLHNLPVGARTRPREVAMARRVQWVLAGLLVAAAPLSAQDDSYRYARVRYAEPSAVLQGAAEAEAEEASANVPFVPGDRLWTDGTGRAELQFFDGNLVWLDSGSKLDYATQEGGDRAVLRLWSGSLALRLWSRDGLGFVVETPAAVVDVVNGAVLRVDVGPDSTRVSVREGAAVVEANGQSLRVTEGERTEVQRDGALEEVWRFGSGDEDQFDGWVDSRDRGSAWASASSRYLPEDLRANDVSNGGKGGKNEDDNDRELVAAHVIEELFHGATEVGCLLLRAHTHRPHRTAPAHLTT